MVGPRLRAPEGTCRYADDCNIYVGSECAGRRAMANIRALLEGHLKLRINEQKKRSGTALETKVPGLCDHDLSKRDTGASCTRKPPETDGSSSRLTAQGARTVLAPHSRGAKSRAAGLG